jgi:hypothetical protein
MSSTALGRAVDGTPDHDPAPSRGIDRVTKVPRMVPPPRPKPRIPLWTREVLFVAVLYVAYEISRGLHNGGLHAATRNGSDILRWERAWDIDPEHFLTHLIAHLTVLAVLASYFYSVMHYVITPVVLVWMYRRHKESYGHARTVLAFGTILGLLGFYFVPTAPPRMLPHGGVTDVLLKFSQYGWWGDDGSVPRGLGSLTNQFAAMPSLHVGWALWCGVLIWRHASHTWLRRLGATYPVLTTVVVVATGNHYLIDALAGVAVMGLALLLTIGFEGLVHRITGPGPSNVPFDEHSTAG